MDVACPTCGESGAQYRGPARAEMFHFMRRALWDLHKARQALESANNADGAHRASWLIRELEYLAEASMEPAAH